MTVRPAEDADDDCVVPAQLRHGVAANGPLREAVSRLCEERGLDLKLVPLELCTDNAAMIAAASQSSRSLAWPEYLAFDPLATPWRS
ncbi:MAG: hypothetical protein ACKOQ5_08440 [Solirubrobacterales bacterium]